MTDPHQGLANLQEELETKLDQSFANMKEELVKVLYQELEKGFAKSKEELVNQGPMDGEKKARTGKQEVAGELIGFVSPCRQRHLR